jgi:hypothetical protein
VDLLLTRVEAAERLHFSIQTVRRFAESVYLAEVQVSARAVHVRARLGRPPGLLRLPAAALDQGIPAP